MVRLFSCCKGPITKGENWCSTLCLIQISHQKLSKHDTVCLQHMQKKKQCINGFLFVPLSQLPVHVSPPSSILYHNSIYNIIQKIHHFNTCEKMTPIFSFNQPLYRTPGHQPYQSPPLREMITSTLMNPRHKREGSQVVTDLKAGNFGAGFSDL